MLVFNLQLTKLTLICLTIFPIHVTECYRMLQNVTECCRMLLNLQIKNALKCTFKMCHIILAWVLSTRLNNSWVLALGGLVPISETNIMCHKLDIVSIHYILCAKNGVKIAGVVGYFVP